MDKHKNSVEGELLERQLSELQKMRQHIDSLVTDLQSKLGERAQTASAQLVRSSSPDLNFFDRQDQTYSVVEMKSFSAKPRPVRLHVLDCLEDIGWMAHTREIAQYSAARYGRDIPPTRFGPLIKDEAASYQSRGTRPVWLCVGLTHDRFEPIRRLLGRSDWPLERRIVAPTSGRIQHLKLTARLCELALGADETAADPLMLKILAADHARDLPGVKLKRGQFDLKLWSDVVKDLLNELLPRDEELRREAAARLGKLSDFQQLFGMPDVIDLEPGHREKVSRR